MLVVSLNLETISKDDEIEVKNYLKLDRRLWNNPQETTARSLRCPNQPKKRNLCPPSGSFLTPSGRRSSRCSRSRIRPNPPDAPALMPGKPSMASSFGCERAVKGTNCLKALATTAAYTARSSGGKNEAFSIFYGPFCSPPATNSAAWTGKGSPPMAAWAKRAAFPNRQATRILHGPQKKGSPRTRRPQSHRPWQGRRPEKRAGRRKRRAAFRRHHRREHARRQIACRPPRRGGRRGSATQPTGTTLRLRQRLGQSDERRCVSRNLLCAARSTHRRGKVRPKRRKEVPCPPLGGGAHFFLVIKMSRDSGWL